MQNENIEDVIKKLNLMIEKNLICDVEAVKHLLSLKTKFSKEEMSKVCISTDFTFHIITKEISEELYYINLARQTKNFKLYKKYKLKRYVKFTDVYYAIKQAKSIAEIDIIEANNTYNDRTFIHTLLQNNQVYKKTVQQRKALSILIKRCKRCYSNTCNICCFMTNALAVTTKKEYEQFVKYVK